MLFRSDVVLDPFGGSGTTLAVAKKLGRRYLGYELSREYAKKITERLSSIEVGEELIGPENPAVSAPRTNHGVRLVRDGTDTNGKTRRIRNAKVQDRMDAR